jgi:hypothetical protein
MLELKDLLPGIISQLGTDNLNELKKIYANYAQSDAKGGMPDLVGNFEDVSNGADEDDMPDLVDG